MTSLFAPLRATLVAFALFQAAAPTTPSVDEIVAKNLAAKGGVERLRALKTVKLTGTMTAQGIEVPMTTWAKRPNLMRQEMRLLDKDIINAFDGTTAWVLDERRSPAPQPMSGPMLLAAREDANFDPVLLDFKERGTIVELGGVEAIDGKPVYRLIVTTKAGRRQEYFLDVETGLERRTLSTMQQGGLSAKVTVDFGDYRTVDGMTVPFSSKQSLNGTVVREVALQKVEFDVPMDDSLFRMPAAAAK